MSIWLLIVDVVRALLFSTAHVLGGGLGTGILVVSLLVRIALLPLTLRIARKALDHQRRIKELAPELERLKRRHAGEPRRLAEASRGLYEKHGVSMLPEGFLRGALVQLPINAALYQAVARGLGRPSSWLWVTDLARPDAMVAAIAAVLGGAAAAAGSSNSRAALITSTAITFAIAWRLSAGVGLYWIASNAVGVGQGFLLRRATVTADR